MNTLAGELVDYGSRGSRYAVIITGRRNRSKRWYIYVWAGTLFIAP